MFKFRICKQRNKKYFRFEKFFSENENNRKINAIMRVIECINIRPNQIERESSGVSYCILCPN